MKVKILSFNDPYCQDPECEHCKICREAIGEIVEVHDIMKICDRIIFALDIPRKGIYHFMDNEVELIC